MKFNLNCKNDVNIFKLKRFDRNKYIVTIQMVILICMYLKNIGVILIAE